MKTLNEAEYAHLRARIASEALAAMIVGEDLMIIEEAACAKAAVAFADALLLELAKERKP